MTTSTPFTPVSTARRASSTVQRVWVNVGELPQPQPGNGAAVGLGLR